MLKVLLSRKGRKVLNNSEKNILITSGGTSEQIDDVRRITNSSTGSLGAEIADAFKSKCNDSNILYLCAESAIRPKADGIIIETITGVLSLKEAVEKACENTKFDIIIHCMAVSDYMVKSVTDSDFMAESVLENLSYTVCGDSSSPKEAIMDGIENVPTMIENKISSNKDNLIVVMEKSPKVISFLRPLAKDSVIVGFKLLSEVEEEDLINVGHMLLQKNDCDFVLANDLKTIKAGAHKGILIDKDKKTTSAIGKKQIAEMIADITLEKTDC